MQRGVVMLVITAAVVLGPLVAASPASAAGGGSGSCNVYEPTCTVGAAGGTGSSDKSDDGNVPSTDPCAAYPDAAYGDTPPKVSQACADALHGWYCQAMVADAADGLEAPPWKWTAAETEAINEGMTEMNCPLVVTPAGLAEQAEGTITFPHPSGDRSPSQDQLYRGYPFTYIGLETFYWTSADTWKPLTATAAADGFTATVTAKPVRLVYDPGDGSAAASCPGPGRPWSTADGNGPPTDGACAYRYTQVTSSPITSTQTIVWKITWTGTHNSAGELPELTTSTSGQLNVMQIQTVVTR